MEIFNSNNNYNNYIIFNNSNNNSYFKYIKGSLSENEKFCQNPQELSYNDDVINQCIVIQSPIIPNKFQLSNYNYQQCINNLITSKYFKIGNIGYLRDEWSLLVLVLFMFLPIISFSVITKFTKIGKSNPQISYRVIKGIAGLYLTTSCLYHMLFRSNENLNYVIFSFLVLQLTNIIILSLFKTSNNNYDKIFDYLHHIISFTFIYLSIYFDKKSIKYILPCVFDDLLYVIDAIGDIFKLLNLNSTYNFIISIIGLGCLILTLLPKQIWILYDTTFYSKSTSTTSLLLILLIFSFEIIYSLYYLKKSVKSYSKIKKNKY